MPFSTDQEGDGGFGGGTLPLVRGPHQSPLR
jgi:hypothetical protein